MPDTPDAEAALRDKLAWRALLGDSDRERALRQILRKAGFDQPHPRGHEEMARAAGAYDVGHYIAERLKLFDPEGWNAFDAAYTHERHNAAASSASETTEAAA